MKKSLSKYYYTGKIVENYPLVIGDGKEYDIYRNILKDYCKTKAKKITILEIGCGTGRYFSLLSNVSKLVGLDISIEMLVKARENLKSNFALKKITTLINSNIYDYKTTQKFDFIYSIGTLGEYCEFNSQLFDKIIDLLLIDGFFFFTIVDSDSFVSNISFKKKVIRFFLKLLPTFIRYRFGSRYIITEDFISLFMSKPQIVNILKNSNNNLKWEITARKDKKHIHHICKVWKIK